MLRDLDRCRLTTEAVAQLLGLERRQVFRLKAYRTEGPAGTDRGASKLWGTLTKIYLRATSSLAMPPPRTVTSRNPQLTANSVMKASW